MINAYSKSHAEWIEPFFHGVLCQLTVIYGISFKYKIHKDVQLRYLSLSAAA